MKHVQIFIIIVVTVLWIGCSGESNSIIPALENETSMTSADLSQPNRYVFGYWTVSVSLDHLNFDVTPVRNGMQHFNIVQMIENSPCDDCLSIHNAELLPGGEIKIDVTVRHPFENAMKLCGFDVRGIVIGNSDYSFPISGREVAWGDQHLRLLNADGYTALFNPTEYPNGSPLPPVFKYTPGQYHMGSGFTATLNPYIAYSEDVERHIFFPGEVKTRTMILELPSGPLKFDYAFDASWVLVDGPVTDPFTDFPPEANCMEAYKINVVTGSGLLPDAGSTVPVQVEVWDHQGVDSISSVTIESPDLFTGEVSLSFSTATGEDSFLFEGTVENELVAYIDLYPLLVRVTDTVADQNLGNVDAWQVALVKVGPKDGWARIWGPGPEITFAYDVAVDSNDNILASGYFESSVDFDPGPSVVEYTANEGGAYISKFDNVGVFQWVNVWPYSGDYSLTIKDFNSDNADNYYLTGYFSGSIDFDPGLGEDIHESTVSWDSFLIKLDINGNYQWGVDWGASGAFTIATDQDGTTYVSGGFSDGDGQVDFDPGNGTEILNTTGCSYTSSFDNQGNFNWVVLWGEGSSSARSTQRGPSNSLYIGGRYNETTDFDPGPDVDERTSFIDGEFFLCRFDANGEYYWVRTWGYEVIGGDSYDLAVNNSGIIFITGGFIGSDIDFDPGSGTALRTASFVDAYLLCFDLEGDFQWVNTWGSDSEEMGRSISVDPDGMLLVSGSFRSMVDFDPGPGLDVCTPNSPYFDAFVSKYYPTGEFQWVTTWGGEANDYTNCIDTDSFGNSFSVGETWGPVDFDPGPEEEFQGETGSRTSYLMKLTPHGTW